MKNALKTLLYGKVNSLVFVALCLLLGGIVADALKMTWDIETMNDEIANQDLPAFVWTQS